MTLGLLTANEEVNRSQVRGVYSTTTYGYFSTPAEYLTPISVEHSYADASTLRQPSIGISCTSSNSSSLPA